MKLFSSVLITILVLGVGFLLFETSIIPLYEQEKESNTSLQFVEHFSFTERKDAFMSRLQYWFRPDDSFSTESGRTLTSSGITF